MPEVHFADDVPSADRRPNAPVLLIVDQAEELITLAGPAERDAFLLYWRRRWMPTRGCGSS